MERIISNAQIENATVKVLCGDSQGTGFYIDETVLLTAWHVVCDVIDNINIIIDGIEYDKSSIIAKDTSKDICLLKVHKSESILPLSPLSIAHNQTCTTYGFPFLGDSGGDSFQGKVNKIKLDHHWDFSYSCDTIKDQIYSYEGLSGAPIVSNHYVVGFVRIQRNESVCAVSVQTIQEFLSSAGIQVVPLEMSDSIPEQLSHNVLNSSPNYRAYDSLNQLLVEAHGWFYCKGSPGSGKTTFSAWFEPIDDEVKICGRYFTKIPYDEIPFSTRVSRNSLIEWFEKSIRENGVSVDILENIEKRIERLPILLEHLQSRLNASNCVFIIDGIDEVTDLDGFLGILPAQLPNNISIVLSGTSFDILPTGIKSKINESNSVEIEPLDIGQCEVFVRKELENKEIETEFVQGLALKSEGHPLYLRYLINFVNGESFSNLESYDWLDEIPAIHGDITVYYDSIWDKFFRDEGKLWIIMLLSQIRGSVKQSALIGMLPEILRVGFLSNISPINYLLKTDESIELYHASFKHYISDKCISLLPQANDYIFNFCSSHKEDYYSIENRLHHLIQSSKADESVAECNQEWADFCAINHVSPDLVLSDVKSVIELAADINVPHEIIRLLLLLQRLEFRYNSVFAENATHIASAMISRGNIEGAMKYLIRDNTLLVGDEDGLYFLQLLYEKDCAKEAEKLLEVFNRKFRKYIQDEYANQGDEGFSLLPILVNIKALALSFNSKGRDAFLKCLNNLDNLKKWKELAEKHGDLNMANIVHSVRIDGSSWMSAYMYRKANFFQPSEGIAKQFKLKIDETWCAPKAMSLVQYKDLESFSGVRLERFEKFGDALAEIEELAETYGYQKDVQSLRTILLALFDDSSKVELVEAMIRDYLNANELPTFIRDENGVDFSAQNAYNLYFENKCQGYILNESSLPILPDKIARNSNWESFLIKILEQVGFIEGILVKERFRPSSLNAIAKDRIVELIDLLDFKLQERTRWDRSYLIPESFLPFIYSRITQLICQECPQNLESLLCHLLNSDRRQLGLFNEGYRDVFYNVIEVLLLENKTDPRILPLVDKVSEFVQNNVQNRWERTPELLRISEYYSLIGKFEEADSVFKTMLNSSMGPSWYKEAQFELLNSTFKLNCRNTDLKKHAHNFASILDEAAGEMTFQRYVRYDKERFVGNLASRGLYNEAINYLTFELMPPPGILNYNAEHQEVDAIYTGAGYIAGANNISIESAILRLLEACRKSNPNIVGAIGVSFILNDDVFRYSNDYGRLIIDSLNSMTSVENRKPIYNELVDVLNSPSFEESKGAFISDLTQALNREYYVELKEFCSQFDINLPHHEVEGYAESVHESTLDKFSEFNIECDKNPRTLSKGELLRLGVDSFQERISIWFPNWSTESSRARDNLKRLMESTEEVIESLKPSIAKIDMEVWTVIDRLLWFFDGVITENDSDLIYDHIGSHFDLLVHTSEENKKKYSWFLEENEPMESDSALIELMVTLQSHPSKWVRNSAYNSLSLIIESEMELVVTKYIECMLKKGYEPTVNVSRNSLKTFIENNPEELARILIAEFSNLKSKLIELGSFDVFFTFYDIAKVLSEKGLSSLEDSIIELIPESIGKNEEVIFEAEEFETVQWKLDWLNDKNLLDKEFCEEIVRHMSECLSGLTIQEVQKSDDYLNRSYPETPFVNRREENMANYCLSKAIFRFVSKENINELASVLLDV